MGNNNMEKNVLILGYSQIVKRKVLPAMLSSKMIEHVTIASRRDIGEEVSVHGQKVSVCKGYEKALSEFSGRLVYVSLPNSLHAEWAIKSLEKGFNVLIDKPSAVRIEDVRRIVQIAKEKKLFVAESNVWACHPVVNRMAEIINERKNDKRYITAIFTSPPLDKDNFRYIKEYGAGIILDRGTYLASCGRVFIGTSVKNVICKVNDINKDTGVDLTISVSIEYEGGSMLQGYCSLAAEYKNYVSVISGGYFMDVDRIFTPPVDQAMQLNIIKQNKSLQLQIEAADTFRTYIEQVKGDIDSQEEYEKYRSIMLSDNEVIDMLKRSAEGGK